MRLFNTLLKLRAKKLNILHWPSSYPQPELGKPNDCIFIEEHIKSVIPYTNSKVLFVSPDGTTKRLHHISRTEENNIEVIRIYFNTNLSPFFLNYYIRLVLLVEIIKLVINGFKPDIIHCHFYQSALWAKLYCKLLNSKLVITEHWTAFIGYPEISASRFKQSAKAFDFANLILPVSHHLNNGICVNTNLNLNAKAIIINNAVNTSLFTFEKKRVNGRVVKLISVARLDEQKDFNNMFEAIKIAENHINIELDIIGGGEIDKYKKIAAELDLKSNITFHGPQNKMFIANKMNESDFLILSSAFENSPCVIGEAHCTGLPVISTNVGGIPEIVTEQNGVLCTPKNKEALAEAILIAQNTNWDYEKISTEALNHFSYSSIGLQIFDAYKSIL